MTQKTQRIGLPARVLKAVAKPFGLRVTNGREDQSSLINRFFKMIGLSTYSWQTWDNEKFISDGYSGNADLYSIVSRITGVAATTYFKVYRVKDEKKFARYKQWTGSRATKESLQAALLIKQQVFEEDNTHPLNELLEKPNSWQSPCEFMEMSIGFKLLTGNRFWFVNTLDAGANAGRPYSIFNLPPQYMTIIIGNTIWTVKGYELNMGSPQEIPKDLIIHSRYWNPNFDMSGSHLWGLSPLKAASKTLDRSNKAEERGTTMLDNAGAAGVMFDKSGKAYSPEQAEAMKRKVNEEVLGLANSGKILMGNGDLGYINFGLTGVELELLKQEEFSFQRLCNIYKAPPGLFLANANATDNNIKAWNRQLITQAVIPALADLRDDWNAIAARYPEKLYVDYDLSVFPELQEDLEKVAKFMAQAWWFTGNEKRLAMGGDEDQDNPMMKAYLVPGTLREISDLDPDALLNEINGQTQEDV